MEQRPQNRIITISVGMLIGMVLIFGCASPRPDSSLQPDRILQARTPIMMTREARAKATGDASDKRLEGFEGRTNAGFATGEAASTAETVQATEEVEPAPTADAIVEAQLTKAPTVSAFLTRLAVTPVGEGTPSPPPGCAGGCTTYPTWCEPPIKGTVADNSGERIYTMPDDDAYDETLIDPDQGEFYFCTAEEAEAAGFRRSSN
jgi:hypothetical protein